MTSTKDSLAELDRYRSQLEETVAKLRKSLRHWQAWEAEYEGMKEEIQHLGDHHTDEDLARVGREFGSELLNDKEIKLLFSDANGGQRDSNQIIGLLSRRLDYVQENVKTASKQLESAEQKLTLSEHVSRPVPRDEEGLPLIDIREELDEEGNVISGVAIPASDTAPHIVEALRKAGVNDLPDTSKRKRPESEEGHPEKDAREKIVKNLDDNVGPDDDTLDQSTPAKQISETQSTSPNSKRVDPKVGKEGAGSVVRKKSVSFAEGTKTEDSKVSRKRQPNPLFAKVRGPPAIATADTVLDVQQKPPHEQLTALLNAEANLMRTVSQDDSEATITSPVMPEETSEDAALRRQMLQYNMQEVVAVVAEIDLDEDANTPPYSEDEDEYNYDDDSSVDEEEDEHGRATNVAFSDEYIRQMKNLEKRLDASMIQNIGPDTNPEPSLHKENTDPEKDGRLKSKGSPTKGVRFATELDVQEAPAVQEGSEQPSAPTHDPASGIPAHTMPRVSRFKGARKVEAQSNEPGEESQAFGAQEPSQPVKSNVIERPMANTSLLPESELPATIRSDNQVLGVPTGPPDRPHADTIIERPFPSHHDVPPQESDEFDPELLQQQAKVEYHRQRNRMIYRQGGFLPTEEDEESEVPIDEHGNEEGRKVSRFKAARLGRK